MPWSKAALVSLFLATASVPATLVAQSTDGAVQGTLPGTLNFVQGQANIDGQPLHATPGNPSPRQLRVGQTLATANGAADILLAPGALLRLGRDTTVQMVAADPTRTEVRLEQGVANVSVNAVRHDDLLLVDQRNGQTQVLSRGLYTFNTATDTMRVFRGEADVFLDPDTTSSVKPEKVKESHQIRLTGDRVKPAKFDRELAESDLLPWTGPRESQAALASDGGLHSAGYNGYGGYGGGYPGGFGFAGSYGYGDPYFAADGFGYPYGPYGFGGYPFFGVGFGFGFGGGYYGRGVYGGRYGYGPAGFPVRGPGRFGYAGGGHGFGGGGFRAGGTAGGFHGGGGGGFHGGGGGRR